MNEKVKKIIEYGARAPHFHPNFPLILFWSQKSGCTSFANWFFSQIGLYEIAMQYNPFIHNYEYDIYKSKARYITKLSRELLKGEKDTLKLVRNPYKRAVSSFVSLIAPPGIENPEWEPIRKFIYNDSTCKKKISFKHFLHYLHANGADADYLNPHYSQQYIQGEEEFVTNYIYLEDFSNEISRIETKYNLQTIPLDTLTRSWHHQAPKMIHKGNYAEADITDPSFPRLPTYQSFYDTEAIQLVTDIFNEDFEAYHYLKMDISTI